MPDNKAFLDTNILLYQLSEDIDKAERYNLFVYDAMIVAAGLHAGCATLFSEDMQNGILIEDQLHICNPFIIQ